MALTRILLWLGYSAGLASLVFALSAAMAVFNGAMTLGILFAGHSLGAALLGVVLSTATFRATSRETNADALLFMCLYWLVMPLIFALPFKLTGLNPTWIGAWFEATSAFTTTGASGLNADELPSAIKFYRASLQMIGGISAVTFTIVVLAALNIFGSGIHRSVLFTLNSGEIFDRLFEIGRLVGAVYLAIALIAYFLLLVGGTSSVDAISLSLSAISTGGLTPRSGPLNLYVSGFSASVLALVCLLGVLNISVIYDFVRTRGLRNFLRLFTNVEHRAIYAFIGVLCLVGIWFAGLTSAFDVILDTIYFVSSTGFSYNVISLDMVPPVILIIIALIGGSALSTAGGVKIIRMLLMFRHLSTDLGRLSHPSRVVPVKFRKQTLPDHAFLSIWMYFFGYALIFGIGIGALGVAGLALPDAMSVSAASLANLGPLWGMTLPESGLGYADMNGLQQGVSLTLMLLGRVEILAVLALASPTFWKN